MRIRTRLLLLILSILLPALVVASVAVVVDSAWALSSGAAANVRAVANIRVRIFMGNLLLSTWRAGKVPTVPIHTVRRL